MNKARVSKSGGKHGAVLVITLLLIVVLAVATVAFMQNTSTDRQTARSIGSHYRAQLAAEAGAAAATAMVADLITRYPDSVTVWQNIGGGTGGAAGTNNEATVLYVRARSANTNLGTRPAQFGAEVRLLAWPLLSRTNAANSTLLSTNAVPVGSVSSSLPFATNNPNVVNLNATNSSRPRPFVGRRSATNAGSPVTAAQWIYLGAQPGPTNANNPAIARYAFWMEDESFKVNVNVATNRLRGASSLGLSPAEVRLDGSLVTSTNPTLRATSPSGEVLAASNVIVARTNLPDSNFPTTLTAVIPANLTDEQAIDELKFLTTTHSAGLDISRGGFKRFNINTTAFTNIYNPVTFGLLDPADTSNVRANLSRVIAAITNTNAAPLFGQRFYRGATSVAGINSTNLVIPNHANIYLNKIAANILDYIDADSQPTIVNIPTNTPNFTNMADFTIRAGQPQFAIEHIGGGINGGPNSVAAFGTENLPRLQEYAIHGRIREMEPIGFNSTNDVPNPPSASYTITLDHYFEFWNPGTKDYAFPAGAFMTIYDQPSFEGPAGGDGLAATDGRPVQLDLSGVEIKAGRIKVLTTAPAAEWNVGLQDALITNAANIDMVTVPLISGQREYSGTTTLVVSTNFPPLNRLFAVRMKGGSDHGRPGGANSATDYGTAMVIGTAGGILESFVGLSITPGSGGNNMLNFVVRNDDIKDTLTSLPAGNRHFLGGGMLYGNTTNNMATATGVLTAGDPRALNEPLEILLHVPAGDDSKTAAFTRFIKTDLGFPSAGRAPADSSMGLPNTNNFTDANPPRPRVSPTNWVDYTLQGTQPPEDASPPSFAPLYVRDGPMKTIGELGHITDPVRGIIANADDRLNSRGGGRTLRIGQPEVAASFPGNQTNSSRTWPSWRLADIFTTTTAETTAPHSNITATNEQGILTNSLGVVRGLANTNGAVVTLHGLINPNGILRDGGAALRASLYGMAGEPAAGLDDPAAQGTLELAGQELLINNLAAIMLARMTNLTGTGLSTGSLNALWERGEISQLTALNAGSDLFGLSMSDVFDRGREELVRRSIEMITTRGSIFTVYAIGQTLQGTNVTSTSRLKQAFQIEPQFAGGAGAFNDGFDPSVPGQVAARFAAPTNYTIRILQTSYD